MQLADQIDRRAGLTRTEFADEYLSPPRPVILTDAMSRWGALGRWTPEFFRNEYGDLQVVVDGEAMALRDLIDRIEASSSDDPAPYLHNQPLAAWPPELSADVSPMPECTQPNWLDSRLFPDLLSLPWVVSPSRKWRAESAEREHGEGDDGFL